MRSSGGINAHMDLLNSMFSHYRGNLGEAQKRARGQAGAYPPGT